jgi:hypothetical protein
MKIQFKRWDGTGDPNDPKTGTTMSVTLASVLAFLRGKVIVGGGGVFADTESFMISFRDGSIMWFVTAGGPPRILLQDPPKP